MNSEFEKHLQRQPMREIPPHWRGQILAAAQPGPATWRDWFWPCPHAWATLGAAWIVIFALNAGTGRSSIQAAQATAPRSHEALLEFRQQQEMLTRLISPTETGEGEPPKPASPRRSQIRSHAVIV